MKLKKFTLHLLLLTSFPIILSLISCNSKSSLGSIILTRIPASVKEADSIDAGSWKYSERVSIVSFDPVRPDKPVEVLTGDFSSARSPDISYNGRFMLFTAKLGENDPWQIWEMNLSSHKYKRVTNVADNCTDPAYLPDGRVIFSRMSKNDTTGICHYLFTCKLDGSDLRQVTWHPHSDFAPTVLSDGRVLWITKQVYPSEGKSMIYIMRPDGTKADLFFGCSDGNTFVSKACEKNEGYIYFIESEKEKGNHGSLFKIKYNRPLHTKQQISRQGSGSYLFVSSQKSGNLLVAFKPSDSGNYGLFSFDPSVNKEPEHIYSDTGFNILEIVTAEEKKRQKRLPSEVDLQVKTGQIMCQDINILGPMTSHHDMKAIKIEILGIGKSLGTIETAQDGSFYLKPLADMPFRIQTVDEKGKTLNGPSGWIWLRPNERRGCVGCHEDPELVPDNRIPLAVKNSPFNIPVHIKKINEKSVELE